MTRLDPIASPALREVSSPGGRPLRGHLPPDDAFARAAGPDVAVDGEVGLVRVYAIFSFDPTTNEVRVRVVDETGRLIRSIPPESVAAMIAAMAGYASR